MENKKPSKNLTEILNKPYARQLVPDESGGYTALIQEFPGCFAEGDTAEEAIKNLNNAAYSWLESAITNGYPIKDPLDFSGYSGKIALRLPKSLHKQIAELAEKEEASINQLIVTALSEYVGEKKAFSGIFEQIKIAMLPQIPEPKIVVLAIGSKNVNIPSYHTSHNTKYLQRIMSAS